MSLPAHILTPFFQLRQTFPLRVPCGPAGNAHIFFSPPIFSSCSCNSVTLTFKSSLFFQVSQYTLGRLLGSDTPPSPVFHRHPLAFFPGLFPPWMIANFAVAATFSGSSRGTAGLSPLLRDTQYHATRFANSLAVQRFSLTLQPSFSVCHEVVLSL